MCTYVCVCVCACMYVCDCVPTPVYIPPSVSLYVLSPSSETVAIFHDVSRSVGLFCHMEEPGQLCLAHGCVVTLDNIDSEEPSNFFEAIANHILPADMGGQFDIFVPLAASGKAQVLWKECLLC